jgi:hypothetical protein
MSCMVHRTLAYPGRLMACVCADTHDAVLARGVPSMPPAAVSPDEATMARSVSFVRCFCFVGAAIALYIAQKVWHSVKVCRQLAYIT